MFPVVLVVPEDPEAREAPSPLDLPDHPGLLFLRLVQEVPQFPKGREGLDPLEDQ